MLKVLSKGQGDMESLTGSHLIGRLVRVGSVRSSRTMLERSCRPYGANREPGCQDLTLASLWLMKPRFESRDCLYSKHALGRRNW